MQVDGTLKYSYLQTKKLAPFVLCEFFLSVLMMVLLVMFCFVSFLVCVTLIQHHG